MLLKSILRDLRDYLNLKKFQEKWLKVRGNNKTRAGNIFPIDVVSVGDYTYGTLNIHYYRQPEEHLSIGSYCSIADDVHFFTGGGHNFLHLSTFPFKNHFTHDKINEATTKGPIVVEDDVWIGNSCIILSGVTIGKGAVIGAGSVVAKDIPPYAVFCGGEIKKFRFNEGIRNKLYDFDLSKIDFQNVDKKFDILYTEITDENVTQILENIQN